MGLFIVPWTFFVLMNLPFMFLEIIINEIAALF